MMQGWWTSRVLPGPAQAPAGQRVQRCFRSTHAVTPDRVAILPRATVAPSVLLEGVAAPIDILDSEEAASRFCGIEGSGVLQLCVHVGTWQSSGRLYQMHEVHFSPLSQPGLVHVLQAKCLCEARPMTPMRPHLERSTTCTRLGAR